MPLSQKGYVLQVQGFSVNDGEGIRSVVFLSGCPLRCQWCANPETWTVNPQLAVYKHKCSNCQSCLAACPQSLFPPGEKSIAESGCDGCGNCVTACPTGALAVLVQETCAKEVIERVKRDAIFFRYSGGGVTFSGGEPTVQTSFLRALVNGFYACGITMNIETCGFFKWEQVADIFDKLDHVFYDIKHMDSTIHAQYTGVPNESILQNAITLFKTGIPMTVRIPIIPGVSGTKSNMQATATFMQNHVPSASVELLPYHRLGNEKYSALGLQRALHEFTVPDERIIENFEDIFKQRGINVVRYR